MRTVTAVAHRGDPYRVRENTLASLRSALERGADAVEIDVRPTRDGVPVLLHDDSFKRLWGHDLLLSDLTARDVTELSGGGVPTLRAAIGAVSAHRLMIDLPGATEESVRAIVGVVRECGAGERVSYTGGPRAMLDVRAADSSAEIAMTWTTLAPPRVTLLDAIKPKWLNYRFGLVSRDLTDRLHRDGLLCSAWTADTARTMRRLIDRGADSVTSNRVDVLAAVIGRTPPPDRPSRGCLSDLRGVAGSGTHARRVAEKPE